MIESDRGAYLYEVYQPISELVLKRLKRNLEVVFLH